MFLWLKSKDIVEQQVYNQTVNMIHHHREKKLESMERGFITNLPTRGSLQCVLAVFQTFQWGETLKNRKWTFDKNEL